MSSNIPPPKMSTNPLRYKRSEDRPRETAREPRMDERSLEGISDPSQGKAFRYGRSESAILEPRASITTPERSLPAQPDESPTSQKYSEAVQFRNRDPNVHHQPRFTPSTDRYPDHRTFEEQGSQAEKEIHHTDEDEISAASADGKPQPKSTTSKSSQGQEAAQYKTTKAKRRRKVNHACIYCRRSHMTCDLERPCTRCVKRSIGHLCRDEPRDTPKTGQPPTSNSMTNPPRMAAPASPPNDDPILETDVVIVSNEIVVDEPPILQPAITEDVQDDGVQDVVPSPTTIMVTGHDPEDQSIVEPEFLGMGAGMMPSQGMMFQDFQGSLVPFNNAEITSEYLLLSNFTRDSLNRRNLTLEQSGDQGTPLSSSEDPSEKKTLPNMNYHFGFGDGTTPFSPTDFAHQSLSQQMYLLEQEQQFQQHQYQIQFQQQRFHDLNQLQQHQPHISLPQVQQQHHALPQLPHESAIYDPNSSENLQFAATYPQTSNLIPNQQNLDFSQQNQLQSSSNGLVPTISSLPLGPLSLHNGHGHGNGNGNGLPTQLGFPTDESSTYNTSGQFLDAPTHPDDFQSSSQPSNFTNGSAESISPEKAKDPQIPQSESKAREYYQTAADPAGNDAPQVRLKELLAAKYQAGLLSPFNYALGYARLNKFMEKNFSPSNRKKVLGSLNQFRPIYRDRAQNLTDVELVLVEMGLEKILMDYDRIFASMSLPACCWRRTGEILRGNKEMAELVNVPVESLRDGKLSIHQILTERSLVAYWEQFGAIAFVPDRENMVTCFTIQTPVPSPALDGSNEKEPEVCHKGDSRPTIAMGSISTVVELGTIDCCTSLKIRRDVHDIPSLIVGNFLPIVPHITK